MPELAGFSSERRDAAMLVVASELADPVGALGLLEHGRIDALFAAGGPASGRGTTALLALPDGSKLHLRPVRHGGWLGGLLREHLLGFGRPLAELQVTAALGAAGAPVPRAVLVVGERRFGPCCRAAVGTLDLEGGLDALRFLESRPASPRIARAAAAAGRAIRRFHDAGGRHADLHAGNLVVREGPSGTEVFVIDLDRARAAAPPSPGRRMRELMRLQRSLEKRHLLNIAGPVARARFLAAYTGHDRALRRALLAHLPRERARTALHRLTWRGA